jgi:hypothetical protein
VDAAAVFHIDRLHFGEGEWVVTFVAARRPVFGFEK